MKKSLSFVLLLGCGGDLAYSPTEQGFDDFENWGGGISGFSPNSTAPGETGGGGGSAVTG